jgi:hypothetical protein
MRINDPRIHRRSIQGTPALFSACGRTWFTATGRPVALGNHTSMRLLIFPSPASIRLIYDMRPCPRRRPCTPAAASSQRRSRLRVPAQDRILGPEQVRFARPGTAAAHVHGGDGRLLEQDCSNCADRCYRRIALVSPRSVCGRAAIGQSCSAISDRSAKSGPGRR